MNKINSLYFEIEPVDINEWSKLRSTIMQHMKENNMKIITWETGLVKCPDKDEKQNDMFYLFHK